MAEGDRGDHHPTPAELDRFLLGEMSPRQAAPVLAHVIKGCDQCRRRMQPLAAAMFGTSDDLPEPRVGTEYDFPLFKAFAAVRRFSGVLTDSEAEGEAAASDLREASPAETSSGTRAERDWALCEQLLEECKILRHKDPETMVSTARLAVTLAERLDPGCQGLAMVTDLQARARAELGNAHRIADDLAGAESYLASALVLSGQGTGDPLLLAHLMDLTSSLYTDQRRFDEALQLLDMVYAIYQQKGDVHAAGRALISKGVSVGYAYDVEEAVRLFIRGLGLIDAGRDPKLAMVGCHNLIWCLVESGQAATARQLFTHCQGFFATHLERLDVVKSVWLEGRIAAALGEDERAERCFRDARSSFQELELLYEVGLVALDMASLWLRAGRTAEVKTLIDRTISIFRARKIRREAIGMLLVVREAFQKDQATEALLRTTAIELLRLEDTLGRRHLVAD
jgi:tetratricopeptide (TPR) repeat protein